MNRYLFFADFLGTKERYSDIQRVLRARELLELTVDLYFVRYLESSDLYVYIVSDSLFVTCPTIEPLLPPIAELFRHFLDLEPSNPTRPPELHLLRGAIGYGEEATTSMLRNNPRIMAIPMLDASLPRVTALEKIRPGSRVFLDENLPRASMSKHESYLLRWKEITGKGDFKANLAEFLWPLLAYRDCQRLVKSTKRIRKTWLTLLRSKEWNKSEYNQGLMIQLDETLKLFIRSLARLDGKLEARNYLLSILPRTPREETNVEFEWGVWFQVLKALTEISRKTGKMDSQLKYAFAVVKEILLQNGYWDLFRGELLRPDYAVFKRAITTLM